MTNYLQNKQKEISYFLSMMALLGITGVSLGAVGAQFFLQELPCPLCLLQRAGIMAIGVGYMMCLVIGHKPRYYALSTLAGIFTMLFAMRQVFLHITPGSGAYGDPVFGIHMYTWVVIIGALAILGNCLVSLYLDDKYDVPAKSKLTLVGKAVVGLFVFTIALNVLLTFMECGFTQCPDNPSDYMYIL